MKSVSTTNYRPAVVAPGLAWMSYNTKPARMSSIGLPDFVTTRPRSLPDFSGRTNVRSQ